MWGGMSDELRVLLKAVGLRVARGGGDMGRLIGFAAEIGLRSVVYGYWLRAFMKGNPENEMECFTAAKFEFVDAMVTGDEAQIESAGEAIQPWMKYGDEKMNGAGVWWSACRHCNTIRIDLRMC